MLLLTVALLTSLIVVVVRGQSRASSGPLI